MPVSGHARYRDGCELRGFGSVTIRASGVAFDGRMKTLGASPVWETRVIVDFDLVESESVAEAAVEAFVDRVLAMAVSQSAIDAIAALGLLLCSCLGAIERPMNLFLV